ncbi:Transmembrane protein 135, partial [Papilio machaon]
DEIKRERDFYRAKGLPCPKDAALAADKPGAGDEPEQPDNTDCHRKDEQVNLFVNLVFEYWVRTLEMKGWLRRTPGKETLIFMLGSAVFFYLMRKDRENRKRTPLFWFFTPPRVSKEVGEPIKGISGRSPACPHKGNCSNYILRGTIQLFGVGCAMTILRTIIPRILTPTKALKSLRLSHLKLGLFFGGYIGIYRLVVCLLCRAYGKDNALYAIPAGFLAGAAFRASPSLPISLAPLTSTLQVCSFYRENSMSSYL